MVGSDSSLMHYVGVDVHQRRSSVCILNSDGKLVKEFCVKGNWAELMERMQLRRPQKAQRNARRNLDRAARGTTQRQGADMPRT